MENINTWKDGLGAIIFVLSLPVVALLYCGAKLLKNQIIEKFKK